MATKPNKHKSVQMRKQFTTRRKTQSAKRLDKVIKLGAVSGVLYLWFMKYDGLILYFGWSGYLIYAPPILLGLSIFRKFKGDYDSFWVNWFFRFVMSLLFFYVPTMLLFVGLNFWYASHQKEKTKMVSLLKVVSRKTSNAKIRVHVNGENQFIYGYKPELDEIKHQDYFNHPVRLNFKEGLFGTYVVTGYSFD